MTTKVRVVAHVEDPPTVAIVGLSFEEARALARVTGRFTAQTVKALLVSLIGLPSVELATTADYRQRTKQSLIAADRCAPSALLSQQAKVKPSTVFSRMTETRNMPTIWQSDEQSKHEWLASRHTHAWGSLAVGLTLIIGTVPLARAVEPHVATPWWVPVGLVLGAVFLLFSLILFVLTTWGMYRPHELNHNCRNWREVSMSSLDYVPSLLNRLDDAMEELESAVRDLRSRADAVPDFEDLASRITDCIRDIEHILLN